MKKVLGLILVLFALSFSSCTENQRVKTFGGTGTIDLPAGQKLVNITWKNNNAWYLTRQMNDSDKVESYTFQESSSFGLVEGTMIIRETR